jgi:hypothetical protein
VVDAGDAEVWMPVHDLIDSYLDTVGRSAGAVIGGYISKYIDLAEAQGLADGDGMAHSRLGGVRRYDDHISEGPDCLYQGADTGGGDPIIIDYEY